MKKAICAILAFTLLALCGCNSSVQEESSGVSHNPGGYVSSKASNLTDGLSAREVSAKTSDTEFTSAMADFSLKLFKNAEKADNTLASPISVMLALAMTANGAKGETLAQMEKALGGLSMASLNAYLKGYTDALYSADGSKLSIADSIWFREGGIDVLTDFLQTDIDYYNAAIYREPFDDNTKNVINDWVKKNTDGMIDSVIDDIDPSVVMYLINAVAFDAEWETKYNELSIYDGVFNGLSGAESCRMMRSTESEYISGNGATGFIKYYKDRKYAFAAFLPDGNVSPDEWLSSISGADYLSLVNGAESGTVYADMPSFEFDYGTSLKAALISMGMELPFEDTADFSSIGTSPLGNIYIGDVIHKTFISVDAAGTRAGAVTAVAMTTECCPTDVHTVTLNRPFAFAIIDTATGLPLFIGTANSIA